MKTHKWSLRTRTRNISLPLRGSCCAPVNFDVRWHVIEALKGIR